MPAIFIVTLFITLFGSKEENQTYSSTRIQLLKKRFDLKVTSKETTQNCKTRPESNRRIKATFSAKQAYLYAILSNQKKFKSDYDPST